MSEYFSQSRLVELNDDVHVLDRLLMSVNVFQFDFIVAFLGFYIVRYFVPNTILGIEQSVKAGLTLAFCFAVFGLVRSNMLDYKKELDIKY